MIMFGIRHSATRQMMPETRGSYSYWDPSHEPTKMPPRLFTSKRNAKLAVTAWAKGYHIASNGYESGPNGSEYWAELATKQPDTPRSKDELEVVEFLLTEQTCDSQ